MKICWLIMVAVAAIFIKENLCVPAIRPSSLRAIFYPEDNWDDCFLDEASSRPGLCKSLEECPEVLQKWDKENIYPKTCYFIKKQQYVCCPLMTSSKVVFTNTQKTDIFHVNTPTTTEKLDSNLLDIFNTRPSNIFLDNIKVSTTTSTTKRPSNIFLDNLIPIATSTTKKPTFILPDIFQTEKPSVVKSRRERECDLQNQHKLETIDVNGAASKSADFPFMAALGWKSKGDNKMWYPCGGILISSRFVLTSAHCAQIEGERPALVRLGDKNPADSKNEAIKIKTFITHPGYDVTAYSNDIALVELEREVNNPIACLWTQHDLPIIKLTALGYSQSKQLFKASLTAIDRQTCQEHYKLNGKFQIIDISDAHLCAGDRKTVHNSCQGDTGGPLVMKLQNVFYVVGITSFGLGCANLPPSIYTRVSSFIDWMEPIIWPEIDVRFDRK